MAKLVQVQANVYFCGSIDKTYQKVIESDESQSCTTHFPNDLEDQKHEKKQSINIDFRIYQLS
jgi:hypothetical protein